MNRAVFLDRDGVINRKAPEGEYILCDEDLEILPDAPGAIRRLSEAGFLVIVATNQRCVAKGLLNEDRLEAIHQVMLSRLRAEGARIQAVYYCPHEAEADCACRKPKPGMLVQAARDHAIDLAASWMIGDSLSDAEAGKAAGCRCILLAGAGAGSHGTASVPWALAGTASVLRDCQVVASLSEAVGYILECSESAL
ncbi:MAG: D-glycero-alpha-D-manno-heptose-1,7-bisphosphate 7-phosphatase [Terriglobia bacterium]